MSASSSSRPSVLITRKIPGSAPLLLQERFTVEVGPSDRFLTQEELLQKVQAREAVLSLLGDRIDDAVLEAAGPRLRIVANYAVGFDNIDLEAATRRGVMVTNTPEVLTETTADFTLALMLAVARRLVESDGFTRRGFYQGWSPDLFLGTDVHGKTLGIVGMGRIGQAVARRARGGFGMRILYYDPVGRVEAAERELGAEPRSLKDLLRESDFVSLHVPLLSSTRHLINQETLKFMKPTAFLINTSRGPVVDEKALVRALRSRSLAGAALDVYEQEPALAEGLDSLSNVLLAPHIASASLETRSRMGEMAAQNILEALSGRVPPNLVNPQVLEASGKKAS